MSGSGTGTPAVAVSTSKTVASWWTGAPFVLERVTQPEIEPVTLAEMKLHLRCFDTVTAEDDEITRLIVAGREWVEDYTGRALIDQTWRITVNPMGAVGGDSVGGYTQMPGFSLIGWQNWQRRGEIALQKSPVLSIELFVSADTAGLETAIAATDYALCEPDSKWPRIAALSGATWSNGALKVEFRAGFADLTGSPQDTAIVVPERFKQAIKLWVEANYDRDEKMMNMLLEAAQNIIKPERAELQLA